MNQKELTKTFMMISKLFGFHGLCERALRVNMHNLFWADNYVIESSLESMKLIKHSNAAIQMMKHSVTSINTIQECSLNQRLFLCSRLEAKWAQTLVIYMGGIDRGPGFTDLLSMITWIIKGAIGKFGCGSVLLAVADSDVPSVRRGKCLPRIERLLLGATETFALDWTIVLPPTVTHCDHGRQGRQDDGTEPPWQ